LTGPRGRLVPPQDCLARPADPPTRSGAV